MKGKFKKSIAFLMVLILIFNMGIAAFAEENETGPSNLNQTEVGTGDNPTLKEDNPTLEDVQKPLETGPIEEDNSEEQPTVSTVAYTVNHYLQNLDETYPSEPEDVDNKSGKIGDTGTAEAKIYTGYTLDAAASTMSGTILEDGSLVLNVYYTATKATYSSGDAGGSENPKQQPVAQKAYEIQYLLKGTDEPILGLDTIIDTAEVGSTIEIPHPTIEGYQVLPEQLIELVIEEDEELNKVVVYYEKVEKVVESVTLTVNHVLVLDDGEEELIEKGTKEGLNLGDTIIGSDLVKEDESLEFLYSDPEELSLDKEGNSITLFYEAKDEVIEIGDNPDHLTEFSTGITKALPFYYPPMPRMMRMALQSSNEPVWPNPGAINLTKSASPVAGTENRWRVTLTIEGKNIQKTSKVVLVIDKSGSMSSNKMSNTKLAAKEFVDQLLLEDGATEIGVVSFDENPHVVSNFTGYADKADLKIAIDGISAGGGTNIQAGIHQAQILLDAVTADNKFIVLLGDGEPTYSYKVSDASGITLEEHKSWQKPKILYNDPQITGIDYTKIVGSGNDFLLSGYLGSSNHRYKIPCTISGHNHGPFTTDFPENNGIPTIYEAGLAKGKGTKIYSIALQAGTNGQSVLNQCQDSGYYELNSSDLSGLSAVFGEIAGNIAYAASSGSVIDPMGAMFDLVSNATEITVSQGTVAISGGNTINWNVGNIVEGTPATMTYIVQIKPGAEADELYPTNDTTTFTYTDAFDNSASKDFEVPHVSIDGGTILIKGYLVNEEGKPINEDGVVVDRPDLAKRLYDNSYSSAPLAYNQTYNVTQPGFAGHQYMKYVWNETTGAEETVSILLQASAPTQIVWFGYKEVTELGYTVKYFVDNVEKTEWQKTGTVPSNNPVVTASAVPDKTPAGYKLDETNSTALPFTVTASKNVIRIYYIPRTDIAYTVNYLEQGTDKVLATAKTGTGTFGTEVTENAIDIDGYNKVDPTEVKIVLAVSGNVINFYYTAIPYHVFYDGNGGDGEMTDPANPYIYDEEVTVLENTFTKTGYHFIGWLRRDIYEVPVAYSIFEIESAPEYLQKGDKFNMPANDVTLYAQWELNEYTITYKAGANGSITGAAIQTVNHGGSTTEVTATPVPGYHFVSWSDGKTNAKRHEENVTASATYTANFAVNTYTVTYAPGTQGTFIAQVTTGLHYGDATPVAPEVTGNPGYIFTGWSPKVAERVTKTVTYTAQWSQDEYTVTYSPGTQGTFTAQVTTGLHYGDTTPVAPKVTGNPGYTFTGWSPKVAERVTKTVTYTAQWSKVIEPPYNPPEKPEKPGKPTKEDEVVIIDEPIPTGLPELNKKDHFQYIQGYPDGTVKPEGNITRDEVAAVFYRLLTDEYRNSIKTDTHKFSDVAASRWSNVHIATLAKVGIVTGYTDGTFRPGNYITRAELATIASRFDKLSPFESDKFSDIKGHWANKYINSAAQKGWVNGYSDGTFKPDQYITRAEFVTLVNNVLERRVSIGEILPESKQFPDLPKNKWYYEAMQEAINSHYYYRLDNSYEDWVEIYYPKLEM